MKQIAIALLSLLRFSFANAQQENDLSANYAKLAKESKPKLGIKVGYNFAKVTGSTTNFSPKANNGFMVAGFFSTKAKTGMGYRTELIFSRQGFSFDDAGKKQDVTQDYIYMPHLTTFTIAGVVQLQAGGQIGYLLNAKKSSSTSETETVTSYMNRIDYGFAGGIEVYPFKGLVLGGRYNVSLGNIYNTSSFSSTPTTPYPLPFNPDDIKGKNAVVQFFVGYRF